MIIAGWSTKFEKVWKKSVIEIFPLELLSQVQRYGIINLIRGFKAQAFSGAFVQLIYFVLYRRIGYFVQINFFWEVFTQQSVRIFICSALSRLMWRRRIEQNLVQCFWYFTVSGKFLSPVRRNQMTGLPGQTTINRMAIAEQGLFSIIADNAMSDESKSACSILTVALIKGHARLFTGHQ